MPVERADEFCDLNLITLDRDTPRWLILSRAAALVEPMIRRRRSAYAKLHQHRRRE